MKLALVLLAATGCGVADFDVDQPIQEQMIQGSPIPGPLQILFPIPLNVDISAQIKAKDTGPIDSVTLKALTLSITKTDEPAGDTGATRRPMTSATTAPRRSPFTRSRSDANYTL